MKPQEKALIVCRPGTSDRGNEIIAAMQQWGMDVSAVQRDHFRPTGVVNVVAVITIINVDIPITHPKIKS